MARPGTVTAAAVIMLGEAGLLFLACCGISFLSGEGELSSQGQTLLTYLTIAFFGFGAFFALLGYLLLQGRQWARITTIVLCALSIAASVIPLFLGLEGAADGLLTTCLGDALNIVIIGLLSNERARDYFRSPRS